MSSSFWKLDTAGNTTLFLEEGGSAFAALRVIPSDQAAYVDMKTRQLTMGGGEFCVNACLAFGALLSALGYAPDEIGISGQIVKLEVEGVMPEWRVRAEFGWPELKWDESDQARICHLDGISHALIHSERLPEPEAGFALAAQLRSRYELDKLPAAGIVWWRELNSGMELLPIISVPGVGTCNLEGACGSASIALALARGAGAYRIQQPSGEALELEVAATRIRVSAKVNYMAAGRLWV